MHEAGWYLETFAEGRLRRLPMATLPFRVGRRLGLELVLPSESVSKLHAEIYEKGAGLRVRDLGSTNGTFVNRSLVADAAIADGDVLHFADCEFRLGRREQPRLPSPGQADVRSTATAVALPHRFVEGTRELRELLRDERVTMAFQPIVELSTGAVVGHEALGRGRHPTLPEEPRELFRIAETIGAEAELSRLFRRKAVELSSRCDGLGTLFLNTHPAEFAGAGLLDSLEELRFATPCLELALEVHESTLTSIAAMVKLRSRLLERSIALAYDNFGAGQARLLEIAEAPPRYLKFAPRYVAALDQAPGGRRRLLGSLVTAARSFQTTTVAVGIDAEAVAQACAALGFTHGQGAWLGPPQTVE